MSGGRFNYHNEAVRFEMEGMWHDAVLNELFYDMFCAPLWGSRTGGLATALDFWLSSDIDEKDYREYVAKFKEKWFGDQSSLEPIIKRYIDEEVEKLHRRMLAEAGMGCEESNE